MIHRAFHALPVTMTAPDGRPTNAVFGLVSMLVKLVTDLAPDGVIIAWDKGRPAFRSDVLEQYKAHRPPTAQELRDQFPMAKAVMEALAVPQVEVEGWEADDILGTIAERGEAEGFRMLLVTGDRDALQLVTDTVTVVSTLKGVSDIKLYDPAAVAERLGVTPEQIVDYLGLKGDTSDNIPGVPGIGEKTAAKLMAEYGSLDAVLAAADDIPGKLGENLRTHADAARVSRQVATIRRDVPLTLDLDDVVWGGFDPAEVARAFGELRFTSLLDRVFATVASPAEVPAEPSRPVTAPSSVATGSRAVEQARALGSGQEWVGVALDDGTGDSLFAVRRDLAVARGSVVAIVEGEAAEGVFGELLASARVASGDVKALLRALCGTDALETADPTRLFDCAVASYLLESNRSSYEIGALSADYLGQPLAADAEGGRVVAEARAAAALADELGRRLGQDRSVEVFERIEMPLVPVLARMECAGVGLDHAVLSGLSEETAGRISTLVAEIHELAGTDFLIDSPKQLAEILFDKLGLPPQRRTKTGFSTDANVLAALAPLHPIAEKIVAYRELAKLKSTYIDALPALLAEDGRLHTTFNQTVAATGRLSSSNPNLQNIPVRTEFGRRIRAAFVPAEHGDLIVSADYSQFELRILAHLSGDTGLLEAFASGADFHAATAARVFGVSVDAVEPGMRARAKAVNFGIVYGQSAHGLAETLKIGHAEAQEMIDRYYAAYSGVRAFLDETVASAHRDGFAVTIFGRKRPIPELKSSNWNLRSFGERTAMNHPMQGSAADIMKLAMIEVDSRLRAERFRSRMVLQVHDELVFEAPPAELETLAAMVREAMSGAAELAVPLEVDVASGPNWASAK
jgi:DNA polymerase-1